MKCELCGREILKSEESKHHLIPKCMGGNKGEVVILHEACHKQIHALFTDRQLYKIYNTINKLKNQRDVRRFVRWISKKPLGFDIKIKIKRNVNN